ncbi:hypothetical protein P389DRAFT_207787 [Cystobasidium minutum MCA 4210]|uniref:uncharacterized protein n=1 Tax=Cystobasidium minutum MCA 4210 TaxID=1397322 RepID=UPI0034CDC883|eukprot:jgi/Rhomi1/207787/estExt_Genemark1.C_1_t20248
MQSAQQQQQPSYYYALPPASSSEPVQAVPSSADLSNGSSSSFTETNTNTGNGFGISPRFQQSELLYPPHQPSKFSTVPFPASTAPSHNGAASHREPSSHRYHQQHLSKSLSRSSISSDGSALLFSPAQDPLQLSNYSPITPPLPLPVESNKSDKIPQSAPSQVHTSAPIGLDSLHTAKPSNRLPLLPDLADQNIQQVDGMATTMPAVMQPGCISRLAQYLAEMVVYLWFSPPGKRAPTFPRPTLSFSRFCNDILTTTQVSQSVVVLALYFVSKLQTRHSIEPRPGSEYKLAIASLMLANKILDDHTYTNKTWSEVSGLPLDVLNGAEVEFLQGLDFDLHVSHTAYKAWYTMLQNGESSNIVKHSQPSRKRAKVVNPVAPSAPTSPMHHTSHASTAANAGLDFDFNFTMPPAAPLSAMPANSFALQIPTSRHSVNTWLGPSQMPMEANYTQQPYSQQMHSVANVSSSQAGNRKRRASDAALSPPTTSVPASLQSNSSNLPQLYPAFMNGIPHIYTPLVSTPNEVATTPQSAHGPSGQQQQQGYFVQDFMPTDLTSSWSPTDELGNRRPQDLTYYALAAGQHRGGYLTHQPLPPYPSYPTYQSGMQMYPQNGRAFAPLPRNVSRSKNMTPVLQQVAGLPQRTSLSLSPVDIRQMYAQAQAAGTHDHHHRYLHPYMQQYPTYPSQGQNRLTPPTTSQAYRTDDRRPTNASSPSALPLAQEQAPIPSPLEPSLQSLALSGRSSGSPGATPMASRQAQPAPPQSYYSSFANNGLSGVLSWPAQAIAQYQTAVQPHQQLLPQNFA